MKWSELDNQTQVYMWWEYNSFLFEDEQISFEEYDNQMKELWVKKSHNFIL